MAKTNVDLTSKEWRDLIFADKNKEFGAYTLRASSDRRHNLAVVYTLIGLLVVFVMIFAWSKYSDYRAEQAAIEAKNQAEKMMQAMIDSQNEETQEEEQVEEQKFEQEIPQVPEEVLATVQVTQIAIVDADKVKNEVMEMEQQMEDNTARGVVNQEGSDDADKFKAVQEQVVVKEPEPVKPKEEEIFVAVEQQAEFPGGIAALYKYLGEHLRYPEDAQKEHIEGRVTVRFVITKTGKVSDVVVIRGKHPSLDAEALRVVKSLPNFKPGMMNGQPVNVYYNLPISFRLQK